MRVRINLDHCSRVGNCFIYHRRLFRERENGCPEVLADPVPEDLRKSAENAVEKCPTGAISIEDE